MRKKTKNTKHLSVEFNATAPQVTASKITTKLSQRLKTAPTKNSTLRPRIYCKAVNVGLH